MSNLILGSCSQNIQPLESSLKKCCVPATQETEVVPCNYADYKGEKEPINEAFELGRIYDTSGATVFSPKIARAGSMIIVVQYNVSRQIDAFMLAVQYRILMAVLPDGQIVAFRCNNACCALLD